jgi:hypothetical protein
VNAFAGAGFALAELTMPLDDPFAHQRDGALKVAIAP